MFRGRVDEFGCPDQVRIDRLDEPDRTARDGCDEGDRGIRSELALQQCVEVGQGEGSEEERLIGPVEPGDGRGMVEIGPVGG